MSRRSVRGPLASLLTTFVRPNPEFLAGFLFGIIFLISASLWTSAYFQEAPNKQKCDAETKSGSKKTEECKTFWQRTTYDPAGFFTFCLVIVGGAQAAFFIWQLILIREGLTDTQKAADAAKEQARLARESLEASNRSWIKVIPTITSDIDFDKSGARVNVKLTFKNIGKSPAFNVYCFPYLCATTNDRNPRDLINKIFAQDPVFREGGGSGFSLLPDEEVEQLFTTVLSQADIATGGFGRSTIPGLEREGSPTHMALDLYGLTRYSDAFGRKWRHTPFIYNIKRPDGLGTFPMAGPVILLTEMRLEATWIAATILD